MTHDAMPMSTFDVPWVVNGPPKSLPQSPTLIGLAVQSIFRWICAANDPICRRHAVRFSVTVFCHSNGCDTSSGPPVYKRKRNKLIVRTIFCSNVLLTINTPQPLIVAGTLPSTGTSVVGNAMGRTTFVNTIALKVLNTEISFCRNCTT